ncbi:FAD dependent oxidoreductase [Xylaria bambusicola]|uniref:FAD dependent oxidoreductase n=1 Tax=Xylaria bambusicola TaxID=326684 RepID=UPI0020080ED4|nr:FAD dependent oxidoreductase [Xylaria bambusicola]KAI0525476.1 FAD dependent oxidoreductase [Xylaria bambusicola]
MHINISMDPLPSEEVASTQRAELPTPNSTHSYWHRDPSKKLLNHHTTEDLPSTADVIVVGSGLSGAFATRELVAGGRSVVMLEAREACWGATGRNGGHCQPNVWGTTEELARFELATFNMVKDLITQHNVPCDWKVVGGIRAIYTEDVLEAAKQQIERLQKYPDLKDKAFLITEIAELAAQHVPDAIGAILQPNAAKLWPYKLVAWILETLVSEHDAAAFNLQTNTPVTNLERDGTSWVAHTPRGTTRAREVLLTTNAYTSYLLPGLTDVILPVRGQVCALEPPQGAVQLPHSYVWTDASDQYLIHRGLDDTQVGVPDRSLVLGGERFAVPEGEEGISRDDAINPIISRALHSSLSKAIKLLPGGEPEKKELRAAYEWTGIMGYSRDSHPFVGRVPASFLAEGESETSATDGLWISAAFTGHGMPVAPRCGIAVAEMMLGKEGGVDIPAAWVPSDERIARARLMELPRTVEDLIRSLPSVD